MKKISILTLITNPKERQDKFEEAFSCYKDFADEVIVVDGGRDKEIDGRVDDLGKMKVVYLHWPREEWNWVELPRHLNEGLKHCTGDWTIRLDIDQLIHERHFIELREILENCPKDFLTATMQKMSFTYRNKFYQKGEQAICLRNNPNIRFGKNFDKKTDLCFPIFQTAIQPFFATFPNKELDDKNTRRSEEIPPYYNLPVGITPKQFKTGVKYFNYDYFFKTKEFTKKEFWRFSRAYYSFFKEWHFGDSEEKSFEIFINMQKGRYKRAPYTAKIEDHPMWLRKAVEELTSEQCGKDLWRMGEVNAGT